MKTLVVFYSRTGYTKVVGEQISKLLKCDKEEILDVKSRKGFLGWIRSGREAAQKKLPKIKPIIKNASEYELIIIGTPVWAFTVSSPVRAYINKNKDNFKKVAFFCTQGGEGEQKTFKEMQQLTNKTPVATLRLLTKEVKKQSEKNKITEFVQMLK